MAIEPEDSLLESEEEEGGPVKPFLDHLEDLRWVLIKVLSALGLGMVICLAAAPVLVNVLTWPLQVSGATINLETMGPVGGVMISMKVAFWGGITLALPFILYFIGEFIMPALKRTEKVYFFRAFIVGGGLFLAGAALCYFVILKISLQGMIAYNRWLGLSATMWRSEDYFQFVLLFMVGMGLSFEVPVLVLTLVRLGVVPHEWLVKGRLYFLVANAALCAFITPDAVSTIFMVVPVQLLLEGCIWISAYWERQKRLAEAGLAAQNTQIRSAD